MRAEAARSLALLLAVIALVGCRRETALTLVYPMEDTDVATDAGVANPGDAGASATPVRTRVWVFPSETACGIVNRLGRCQRDCDALWAETGGNDGVISGVHLRTPPLVRAAVEGRDLPPLSLPSGRSWDVLVRVDLVPGTIHATGVTVDEGFDDPGDDGEYPELPEDATYYACETVDSGSPADLNLWRPWCSRRRCLGRVVRDDECWGSEPVDTCCGEARCESPRLAEPPCETNELRDYWPFADVDFEDGACVAYTLVCETGSARPGRAPESDPACIDARDAPDPLVPGNDRDCDSIIDWCVGDAGDCAGGGDGTAISCRTDAGMGTGSCVGEQWTGCLLPGDAADGCSGGFEEGPERDDDMDGYVDEGVRGYVTGDAGMRRRDFLADGGVPDTNQPTACNTAHDRDAGVAWNACGVSPDLRTSRATCLCGGDECGAEEVCCDGECVNLLSNPHHCGACDREVREGETCNRGRPCIAGSGGPRSCNCVSGCAIEPARSFNLGRSERFPRTRSDEVAHCESSVGGPCEAHEYCAETAPDSGSWTCRPY